MNYCIIPVRWAQRWLVPPQGNGMDWRRVSFQPMLYLFLFCGAIFIIIFGDPFSNPPDKGEPNALFLLWDGMVIIGPPSALASLWLIVRAPPRWKYFGFWLRLTADIMVFAAMTAYCWLRFSLGDFHIYPIVVLLASTLFVGHLVMRDIRTLYQVEKLANHLHRSSRNDACG